MLFRSLLMLSSHNILNPANGAPITVPSQDMVLGLYYLTKERKGEKGEGHRFYSAEEVIIAFNEGKISKHAIVKVRVKTRDKKTGEYYYKVIETTVGRIIFNQVVPEEVGYVDELLTKKKLQVIIGTVFKQAGLAKTAKFLDDIKELGFQTAFKGGLSMGLNDVKVPSEKDKLVVGAQEEVDAVWNNYMMGLIKIGRAHV